LDALIACASNITAVPTNAPLRSTTSDSHRRPLCLTHYICHSRRQEPVRNQQQCCSTQRVLGGSDLQPNSAVPWCARTLMINAPLLLLVRCRRLTEATRDRV